MGVCKSSANRPNMASNVTQHQKPSTSKGIQIQSQMKAVVTEAGKITDKAPKQVKPQAMKIVNILKKTEEMALATISETEKLLDKAPMGVKSEANKIGQKIGIGPITDKVPKEQKACSAEDVEKLETGEVEEENKAVPVESRSGEEEPKPDKVCQLQSQVQNVAQEVSKFSSKAPEPLKKPVENIARVLEKAGDVPTEKILSELTKLIEKAPPDVKSTANKVASKIGVNLQEQTLESKIQVENNAPKDDWDNTEEVQIVTTEAVAVGSDADEAEMKGLGQLDRMEVLRSKFKQSELSGDKILSREEFLAFWKTHPIVAIGGKDAFEQIDVDNDGAITLNEFETWYLHQQWNMVVANFKKKMEDQNKRKITKKEFLEVCMSNFLCPASRAKKLFKKLDVNGDGKLSFQELSDEKEQNYIVRTLQESFRKRPPEEITKFHLVHKNGVVELNDSTVVEAFNQIDWKMRDRKVTLEEFVAYFSHQGVSKVTCKRLFLDIAKKRYGFFGFEEFKKYLANPPPAAKEVRSRRTRSRRNVH